MKKAWLISCLIFIAFSSLADQTKGVCVFYDKPEGKTLFSTNKPIEISGIWMKHPWQQVSVEIWLAYADYTKEIPVRSGEKLINAEGDTIGEALVDLPNAIFSIEEETLSGFIPGEYVLVELSGNIRTENVDYTTTPEYWIQSVLQKVNRPSYEDFRVLIDSLYFSDQSYLSEVYPAYTYAVLDTEYWPEGRIIFLFSENQLFGLIHVNPITGPTTTTYPLSDFQWLTIYETPEKVPVEEFLRVIRDSYAGKN